MNSRFFRRCRAGLRVALAAGLAMTAMRSPATAAPEDLETALQRWLARRYRHAYVAVLSVADEQAEVVVTVVPAARLPDEDAQAETFAMAESLREEVLSAYPEVTDFRPGSQFAILGPERLKVEGAGEELTRVVGEVVQGVIEEVTRQGLSVQYLAAVGYGGPQVAMEIQARGVGLGEDGRERAREDLEREIRETVMGERYSWIAYLPEQSLVEVWDAARPPDVPLSALEPPEPEPAPWPEAEPEAAPEGEPATIGDTGIPLEAWTDPGTIAPDLAPPTAADDLDEMGRKVMEQITRKPEPPGSGEHEVLAEEVIPAEETRPLRAGRSGKALDPAWTPDSLRRPTRVGETRPPRGATLEELVPPSRRALWRAPRKHAEPGALARRLRELRARSPWVPPLPPPVAVDVQTDDVVEPPRAYPAAPFGRGPGVASCELFVRFDTDRSEIKPEENERLMNFLSMVPAKTIRGIWVTGHADSRAEDPYNLGLGSRRAWAVKKWFVEHGVKDLRIEVKSRGERDPMKSNQTDYGRSVNRRAEIQVSFADPERPIHTDRSPFWRKHRSLPLPPRRDRWGRYKPYDSHWPQPYSPKVSPSADPSF